MQHVLEKYGIKGTTLKQLVFVVVNPGKYNGGRNQNTSTGQLSKLV